MSTFADRAVSHLRENVAPTSDLGLLFRAGNAASPLDALEAIRDLRLRLDQLADDAALHARRTGASWSAIGCALDITKQAAQQRWGNITRFAGWDPTPV
jgi:hypothetical protein